MITSLGKFLRKLRIDNNEILLDMAKRLDVSPAFLSAIENGKKSIPSKLTAKICELYNLSTQESNNFDQAIAETERSCKIDLTDVKKTNIGVAVSFARKFADMDEEQIEAIRKILGD